MQQADDDNSSGAAGGAPNNSTADIGPYIEFTVEPLREMDEALIESWLVLSLLDAATVMIDDLRERYGMDPWVISRLQHLKNVLVVAEERLKGADRRGGAAVDELMGGLAALRRAA